MVRPVGLDVRGFGIFSVVENQLLVLDNRQLVLELVLSSQLWKPTIGKEKQSLVVSLGPHRVYTECLEVYTESTQKIRGPHRVYTEWFWVYTESTQTSQFRVYTEQFWVYTGSTQNDSVSIQSLYRGIKIWTGSTENNLGSAYILQRAIEIYTESTQKPDQS